MLLYYSQSDQDLPRNAATNMSEVQSVKDGMKRLRHPTRGFVDLSYVALTPDGQPDLSFVIYMPHPAKEN
ncbi:hypothetical protein [Sphingomonas sp.]|uniref:MmyB family transcriptional regulator n=1 Tax=Sphingomonas sp. TaxID=28214 RepID=UPI003B00ADA5